MKAGVSVCGNSVVKVLGYWLNGYEFKSQHNQDTWLKARQKKKKKQVNVKRFSLIISTSIDLFWIVTRVMVRHKCNGFAALIT